MIKVRKSVEETEHIPLRDRIEKALVLAIRRSYWNERLPVFQVVGMYTEPGIVCIKGDRRYRLKCDRPQRWVEDVIFYRTHIAVFDELPS